MLFILLMCSSAFSKFSIINEFFIVKNAVLEKDSCQKILSRKRKKTREKEGFTPKMVKASTE